jgi:hypothetical protein
MGIIVIFASQQCFEDQISNVCIIEVIRSQGLSTWPIINSIEVFSIVVVIYLS